MQFGGGPAPGFRQPASALLDRGHRNWACSCSSSERPLTAYLNLPDPVLISLLALGTAFYIPLGVRRGYIQGIHAFGPLAINFMLEGLVRLGGVFVLIRIGSGRKRRSAGQRAGGHCRLFCRTSESRLTFLPLPGSSDFVSRRIAGDRFLFRPDGHQQLRHRSGEAFLSLRSKLDFMLRSRWSAGW